MKTEDNNRMEALACIIADLKTENRELTQRVHQLVDEYNNVVRKLNGKEKHQDEDPAKQTLGEMMRMRDLCDKLEGENKELIQHGIQLQTERDEAETRANYVELQKEILFLQIARFDNLEFKDIGADCACRPFAPESGPVKVGSIECCTCRHFLNMGKSFCVLCACRYDNMTAMEAQEYKNAND